MAIRGNRDVLVSKLLIPLDGKFAQKRVTIFYGSANYENVVINSHGKTTLGLIDDKSVISPLIARYGFDMPNDTTYNFTGIKSIERAIQNYYRDICAAYASVVDGQGVEDAAFFDPEISGPHPLVVLETDGKAYWWNDSLPLGWTPSSQKY